ncbi:MAG: DNA repair protein RadA, partial [Chrysiogenetes bacterium]|nr:DNA repair protein RadA [Chrysiogenetes bacterium]
MAKTRTVFACAECGHQSPKWVGRCPDCGAWNSFAEEVVGPAVRSKSPLSGAESEPTLLAELDQNEGARLTTGLSELDRVLGGGLVPGSVVLLGGDPGIGKSTLLLQALCNLARSLGKEGEKSPVLYVSGEESGAQIRMRAERLGIADAPVNLMCETSLEAVLDQLRKNKPLILAIDSIQTIATESLTSVPGSVSQVREAAGRLTKVAKQEGVIIWLVGHLTKEGALAGPKVLEHLVDTVAYFEGDRGTPYRILRTVKNRFGSTNEIGVFEMKGSGLDEIDNPSALFLDERPERVSGSVVTCALEGTRPLLAEVQALVADSRLGNPRRTALGVDNQRTQLLAAVLEKRGGIHLADQDVFVNAAGGVSLTEPAADLAILTSIASSSMGRPVDPKAITFG